MSKNNPVPPKPASQPSKNIPVQPQNRPANHKRKLPVEETEHPFMYHLECKESMLHKLMNEIFHIADNDLLLSDKDSGENDYSMMLKFADKLDFFCEVLVGLSKRCTEHAQDIRDKVDAARDCKVYMQDIILDMDIEQPTTKLERSDTLKEILCKLHGLQYGTESVKWICDHSKLTKHEHAAFVSDDESDEEAFYESNIDTKFKFAKYNNNDKTIYKCLECNKKLRDSQELQNHMSNHKLKIYRCLKCFTVSRTIRSHEVHMDTHLKPKLYTCPHPSCGSSFNMQSSLSNHVQMHDKRLQCDKCNRSFQYKQGYLEHITYRHLKTKSIPCPSCPLMFWTLTSMRSHRAKKHMLVSEMFFEDTDAAWKKNNKES